METIENKEELLQIEGGFFSIGLVGGIIAGIVFLIGLFDGYTRPLACRR